MKVVSIQEVVDGLDDGTLHFDTLKEIRGYVLVEDGMGEIWLVMP